MIKAETLKVKFRDSKKSGGADRVLSLGLGVVI